MGHGNIQPSRPNIYTIHPSLNRILLLEERYFLSWIFEVVCEFTDPEAVSVFNIQPYREGESTPQRHLSLLLASFESLEVDDRAGAISIHH